MKQEFSYISDIEIIPIYDVLDLHKISHDHIILQARSSNKIRFLPLLAGSTKCSIQKRETKSGIEYTTSFSASLNGDGKQNGATYIREPVLVILHYCDQPSRLIGTQYIPVYIESYIDEHKETINFNHSSFQYPPLVTIIE